MGKIIKNGIDYGGGVAIDSALDATSMNAIANKPVAEAITQLNNDLNDYVIIRANNKTNVSIGAEANVEITGYVDVISDYKPLLVIYKNNNGSNAIFVSDAVSDITSDGVGLKYSLRITNPTNITFNNFTVRMRVVYIRDV